MDRRQVQPRTGSDRALPPRSADELLAIEGVTLSFGGVAALQDVSVSVRSGCVTAIIGPNGAGKTSLFNVISGFYRPSRGRIALAGRNILRDPAHARARLGVARTFQNLTLFPGMSVLENIKVGAHPRLRANLLTAALYLGRAKREEDTLARAIDRDLLELLDLREIRDRPVSGLPYGVQKRVDLARALVTAPRLLLLDEPAAGMNAPEKAAMAGYIRRFVSERGTTVLLIDHDMELIMGLSDHVAVLNFGRVIAAGAPQAVQRDPGVIGAYLGTA